MSAVSPSLTHATSIEEIVWGVVLIAATMAIHAVAMPATQLASGRLWVWRSNRGSFIHGVLVLLAASWMIVVTHLIEVVVWSTFFVWRDAFPNASAAYYFSLLQYTTIGSDLTLPDRWRLLGGMIGMAGLLTFAWSTTVLLTLAQRVQDEGLQRIGALTAARRSKATGDAATGGQP